MRLNGQLIREFLAKEKKSYEWLAAQLNCSLATVNKMLGGRITKDGRLVQLARVMGVHAEDLIIETADTAEKRSA